MPKITAMVDGAWWIQVEVVPAEATACCSGWSRKGWRGGGIVLGNTYSDRRCEFARELTPDNNGVENAPIRAKGKISVGERK